MHLIDIVQRQTHPLAWSEGEKIPWNEPAFSQRMLREHLTQEHDMASRRFNRIDQQVAWIHQYLLGGKPSHVLDLGCGPGLYAQRLYRLGHTLTGVDFSPASMAYAREQALAEGLAITYLEEDLRTAEPGHGFDLVMLIYGEFNTFSPADAGLILDNAREALAPGGILLLEPHTFEAVKQIGERPPYWYTKQSGLYSDRPHILLGESTWDAESLTTTQRYYVIDAGTGDVSRLASSMQAYDEKAYRRLLETHGFTQINIYPSLTGQVDESSGTLMAISARKE